MAQQPPQQPPSASSSSTDSSVTHLSWEGDKMLNIYVYDYCRKRGFMDTAEHLFKEADIPITAQPPINAPQGLLFEWWTVFWELFTAKSNRNHLNGDASIYLEVQSNRIRAQHQAALQQQGQPGQPYTQQQLSQQQLQHHAMQQKYNALNPKLPPGAAGQPAMGMGAVNGFHPQPSHPQQPGPGGGPPQQAPGQNPQAGPSTQPHHPPGAGQNPNLSHLANNQRLAMQQAQQRAMGASSTQQYASPSMSHAQPGGAMGGGAGAGNMGPPAPSPHLRAATSVGVAGQGGAVGGPSGQPGVNRTPSQQYQALAARPGSRSATPMHSSHSSPSYSAGRGGAGAAQGATTEEMNQMQRFHLQNAELTKMDQELMQFPPSTIKMITEAAGLGDKQFSTLGIEEKFRFFNEYRRLQATGAFPLQRRQPGMVNGHPANGHPSHAQMMSMAQGGMMSAQGSVQGGMGAQGAGMAGSMGGHGAGSGAAGAQHAGNMMGMMPTQTGMMHLQQQHAQHQSGAMHPPQSHHGQGMIPPQAGLHHPQGAGGMQPSQHGMAPHQPGMQPPQAGLQSQHPPQQGMQPGQGGMQHPQSAMQPGMQHPPGMQPPQAGLHPQGPQRTGTMGPGGAQRTGIKRGSPSDVDTESPPKDASPPDAKRRRRNSQTGINPAQHPPGQHFQPQAGTSMGGPQATMNGHPPQTTMNGPQPPSMNGIMGQRNGMPGGAGGGRPGMMGAMGGPQMHMNSMMNGMNPALMNPTMMNNANIQLQHLQRMQQMQHGTTSMPSQVPQGAAGSGAQGGPGAQPPKAGLGASPGGPGHDATDQSGGQRSTPGPGVGRLNKTMMPPPSPSAKGKEGQPSTPASSHVDQSTASPHTRPASTSGNANSGAPVTPNNSMPNYATSTDTSPSANTSSNTASGGTSSQTISPSMLNSFLQPGASASGSTAAGGASSGSNGGAGGSNTVPNPNQMLSRLQQQQSTSSSSLSAPSSSGLQSAAFAADLFPMIEGLDSAIFPTDGLGAFGGLGGLSGLGGVGLKTDDFLENDFALYFAADQDGGDPITGGAGS